MKSTSNIKEMTTVIQSLLKIHKEISSEKVKDEIVKTIKTLLSPDFWGEKHAVSKKAQEFAKDKGYTKKPLELSSWNDLGHKDLKDDKKKGHNGTRGLILEHIILRSDIMKLLLKCKPDDKKEIEKIIKHTKCAVIHWEEDDELTYDGYGDERSNPKEAYKKIKLIFPPGYKNISDFIDAGWVKNKIASLY
jgi:hypothetical protein